MKVRHIYEDDECRLHSLQPCSWVGCVKRILEWQTYCTEHYDCKQDGPKHITANLEAPPPPNPPAEAKSKFDD